MTRAALRVLGFAALFGSGCEPATAPLIPTTPPAIAIAVAPSDAGAPVLDAGRMRPVLAEPALVVPAGALDAFFTSLAAAETSSADGRALISIFGDSHTAGDRFTSRLRHQLQARFGDAGRGLVGAGRPPMKYYELTDVASGATGTWKISIGGKHDGVEPFGLLGFRVDGSRDAEAWVGTCNPCESGSTVSKFDLFYLQQPDGGELRYSVDGGVWTKLSTKASSASPMVQSIPVSEGPHRLSLRAAGKKTVSLFGVALERNHPGVIVDGMGVIGRTLAQLRSWDWSIIGAQLVMRNPRLVVLQYGTNEVDDKDLDLGHLGDHFVDMIERIRATVPSASILVLGPPDRSVRDGHKRFCERQEKVTLTPSAECTWHTPDRLRDIVAAEELAASREHVAFFNTFSAFGGSDVMLTLAEGDGAAKLAYADHVHFTAAGYARWADLLLGELDVQYQQWRARRGLPVEAPRFFAPPPLAPLPVGAH